MTIDEIRKRLEHRADSRWGIHAFNDNAPTDIAYLLEQNEKLGAVREIVAWIEELNDLLPWLWKRANERQNYKHYMAAGETYRFIAKSKECICEALAALEKGKVDDQK